jgi:hypothetical protein
VGIISRIAVVEGSFPGSKEQADFDRVAYTGHVPVKVVGPCRNGQYLVPSGNDDGEYSEQNTL